MKNTKILKFIGKGQITLPLEWRMLLELEESGAVKSYIEGDKIIIEKLSLDNKKDWDIKNISLNELHNEDKEIVKNGRNSYKKNKKDAFYTSDKFFS